MKIRTCVTHLHYRDCSEMHSGSCSRMTLSFKCPIFKMLFFNSSTGEECPSGWLDLGKNCYKIFNDSLILNYEEAQERCLSNSARPATLKCRESQQLMRDVAFSKKNRIVFLGIRLDGNRYAWIDNTSVPTDLISWNSRQSDDSCVEMEYGDGTLNGIYCDDASYGILVCEKVPGVLITGITYATQLVIKDSTDCFVIAVKITHQL